MNRECYILYGIKDNNTFYISNTNPIIWANNVVEAKAYVTRYTGEYEILKDYDNYRSISKHIENGILDSIFIAKLVNGEEVWRAKLL